MKNNKWICLNCGNKKEEYEASMCDKCWLEEQTPKTKEEARQYAINWQTGYASQRDLSYLELSKWQDLFTELGRKFGLLKEFKENGII